MTEGIPKKLWHLPARTLRRYRARAALRALASSEHPRASMVGEALQATRDGAFSQPEKRWMALIEQRRQRLLQSDTEIAVLDYGAGSAGACRSREAMHEGVQSTALVGNLCKASKSEFWGRFFVRLARSLTPASCVELGSCVGISASYLAAALRLNGKGHVVTLEGSPEIAEVAKGTLHELGLNNATVVVGPFHETLGNVLASAQPIDFFFNDGHHDYDAVIRSFEALLPSLAGDAVVLFDDIAWSPGMRQAWAEIEDHERVAVSVDLQSIGIALVEQGPQAKQRVRIPVSDL